MFPMKSSLHALAVAGALLTTSTAVQAQQGDILGQLLGAVFGNNQQATEQVLENDGSQGRRPFAQRRDQFNTRIDTAVQNGTLDRNEAQDMHREYDDIVRLESQYSANGNVSQQQRSDLRTRFRGLMQHANQRAGGQGGFQGGNYQNGINGNWQPLSTRSAEFEQQIAAGLRNRTLTQASANRLRSDWRALAQVEAGYQRGGIDAREAADLEARYAALDARIGGGVSAGTGAARWSQMETRLATVERNGSISRNDAAMIRAQLGDLARLDTAYGAGGYSSEQRNYLARRQSELESVMSGRR
jgi:hypothetical protein